MSESITNPERYVLGLLDYLVPAEVCSDDHLADTPARVIKAFQEYLKGYDQDPREILEKRFVADYDEIILLKDIPFYSLCAHHLAPFHGTAHVGYIPRKIDVAKYEITGLSKLARLVECYARRLQVQERLTRDIANALKVWLQPQGVAVVVEAEHMCIACRGIQKPHTKTITSVMDGVFEDEAARAEVLTLISGI
jgi:GTP cyclohydrolase I